MSTLILACVAVQLIEQEQARLKGAHQGIVVCVNCGGDLCFTGESPNILGSARCDTCGFIFTWQGRAIVGAGFGKPQPVVD